MGIFDNIKISKLIKLLNAYGFEKRRQSGSHMSFTRKGVNRPIVIAVHGKEAPLYLTKEVAKVLNLTPEQFLKELNKFR